MLISSMKLYPRLSKLEAVDFKTTIRWHDRKYCFNL